MEATVKETSIQVQPAQHWNTQESCLRKCRYPMKRRAIKDAHELAAVSPSSVFTVYECQHCGGYHIGRVRTE